MNIIGKILNYKGGNIEIQKSCFLYFYTCSIIWKENEWKRKVYEKRHQNKRSNLLKNKLNIEDCYFPLSYVFIYLSLYFMHYFVNEYIIFKNIIVI